MRVRRRFGSVVSTTSETVTSKPAPFQSVDEQGSQHAALPDLIPDLLDLAHDAFIVTSVPAGTVSYWSRAASAIYGWTAEEAAGRQIDDLLGTVFPVALADIQKLMLETGLWEGELVQSTRTGRSIVVRSRWAPRCDRAGNVEALLQINRDITAEKLVHDQLARSEFQFRYMVENADEGIVQTSPTGSILFANQRFTDLLGVPFEGIIGRSIFDFTDEVGYHLVQGQPGSRATGTHDTFSPEVTWVCADGKKVFTRVSAAAMQDQEGAHNGSLSLIRDIGEKKKAQELLANLSQELEVRVAARTAELASVNQELEAFAYSVSHDLRAPLRGIDGFSHALLEDYSDSLDETGQDYLRRLRASAQRMAMLIDDMLTLSRVNRGTVATTQIHHSPRGERVVVRVVGGGHEATLEVIDHGPGIEPDLEPVIFERFRHGPKGGSGLGLAIARNVVERHGGRISVDSKPGAGARFQIVLPVSS